ncbi:MAG: hypothetical protein RMK52_07355 [Chitinophagales bacterium]|nr:hypothetical protein [Chitinophagales bacterium]MDW8394047.1 hypothetical protein [Chitinophagales bacterium]
MHLLLLIQNGYGQWLSYSARSSGMGNTGLDLSDVTGVLLNPAALAGQEATTLLASAHQPYMLAELGTYNVAAAIPIRHAGWGLALTYSGYEAFNQKKAALSYGRSITEFISLGIQLDYIQTAVSEYGTSHTFTGDVGTLVAISSQLRLAAHVFNPYPINWGFGEQKVPTVFRMGLAYRPAEPLLINAEVEKDIDQPGRIKTGVEYQPADPLFLRAGLLTNPAVFCAGAGLRLGRMQLDFSAQYHQVLGITPAASVWLVLPAKSKAAQ